MSKDLKFLVIDDKTTSDEVLNLPKGSLIEQITFGTLSFSNETSFTIAQVILAFEKIQKNGAEQNKFYTQAQIIEFANTISF